jgi:hypothetical protein
MRHYCLIAKINRRDSPSVNELPLKKRMVRENPSSIPSEINFCQTLLTIGQTPDY